MNIYWKHAVSTAVVASSLMLAVPFALADGAAASSSAKLVRIADAAQASYAINESASIEVKRIAVQKTAAGWTIGTVVKLYNQSGVPVRIPDGELRAKAADGTVYTLQPSAANVRSISPQSSADLSYLIELESKAPELTVTDLLWIDVDNSVYPKVETALADAPVGAEAWRGSDSFIADGDLLNWGEAFAIPGESSALTYTASSLSTQFAGQSPSYVLQLKVDNPGAFAETVPDFTIGGKTDGKLFVGKRLEQSPVTVTPGTPQYIHIAITTDPDVQLNGLYVLSPVSFLKQGQQTPLQWYAGGIGIKLPTAETAMPALPAYEYGTRIAIDAVSKAVSPQVGVSVSRVDWFENEGQTFKTAVAKVKYTNNGTKSVPVPELGADLVNGAGTAYTGTKAASAVKELPPGLSAVSELTFAVPKSDAGDNFTLKLTEQQGQAGFRTPVAQLNVAVIQTEPTSTSTLSLYPYELKLNSWSLAMVTTSNAATLKYNYTYKLDMWVDNQTTGDVVTDPANPRLLMELSTDSRERVGYKAFNLSGDNRLMSGSQVIYFDNVNVNELQWPITVKVYETVSTPLGDAKRLITQLRP